MDHGRELPPQLPFKSRDLITVQRLTLTFGVTAGIRGRRNPQPSADPLHIHTDYSAALALAAESLDRKASKLVHGGFVTVGYRLPDRLRQCFHAKLLTDPFRELRSPALTGLR